MGNMVLGRVFLRVLRCSPVSIIPPVLHNIFIFMLLLPEGQTDEDLKHLKGSAVSESGERWIENYFHLFSL
jgi:hypothetical protein